MPAAESLPTGRTHVTCTSLIAASRATISRPDAAGLDLGRRAGRPHRGRHASYLRRDRPLLAGRRPGAAADHQADRLEGCRAGTALVPDRQLEPPPAGEPGGAYQDVLV